MSTGQQILRNAITVAAHQGITLNELATRAGLTVDTLRAVQDGEQMTIDELGYIAAALGVPAESLLEGVTR